MKKVEKLKYEIDPSNRLILGQFRYVIDGTFKTDKNNTLIYHIKSPSPPAIPQQLKLTGSWSLDKNHNLVLTLDKENNQRAGDRLTLTGEIINAQDDKLEFSLVTKDHAGKNSFYILRLAGRWQADKYNRLSFLVSKKDGLGNELTLSAGWELNKQNQLVYTYIKECLKTKKKISRSIAFKGFWDIAEKSRISYLLNKELNSGFDFQVSAGKPAARGLEYEITIGAMPTKKKITLSGSWKLNPKIGILFEMPYAEGKIRSIIFGGSCKLNDDYTLEAKLKNNLRQELGINLKLSRKILRNQGEAFLQALKENKEISLGAGIGFRW